jgi:hypothetical protein
LDVVVAITVGDTAVVEVCAGGGDDGDECVLGVVPHPATVADQPTSTHAATAACPSMRRFLTTMVALPHRR